MLKEFYGREKEVAFLRREFEACAKRDEQGRYAGPRMVFVVAESGIGKSRLVQELFSQLTKDPTWDPDNYWPESIGGTDIQLLTVPVMEGHAPKGPPRFVWLGARWQPTDVRNVLGRVSVLPELRSSVKVHVKIREDFGSVWSAAGNRLFNSLKEQAIDELTSEVIGQVVPLGGPAMKLVKGTMNLIQDRLAGPMSQEIVAEEISKSDIDEVLKYIRLLLDCKGAVPTVLWLDDAQWIDQQTLSLLQKLWSMAASRQWPLFIIATHWEREWRELAHAERDGYAGDTLHDFLRENGVSVLELPTAENETLAAYLAASLPGITPEQRELLIEKSAGNFLTMRENIGMLTGKPRHFVGERIDGPLSEIGNKVALTFVAKREEHVAQRFDGFEPEIQDMLGWSSQMGARFLADVVAAYASEKLQHINPGKIIDRCVDPYVVLDKPSVLTCEFRDKAYHRVASEYREVYLQADKDRLSEILRDRLVDMVNNSFDEDGELIWWEGRGAIAPPERSVAALDDQDRRELLGIAMREIPLPQSPDWETPKHAAALRAICMMIHVNQLDNLWGSVAKYCRLLRGVIWKDIPIRVISVSFRDRLIASSKTSGEFGIAETLAVDVLTICRRLADKLRTPENQRDVSTSLIRLADIEAARGDLDAALSKYQESLTIRRRLTEELRAPESQRGVSISLSRVADIEVARGDLDAALSKYQESLTICRRLAEELRTPESQRDVSISLSRVADIEVARGDLDAALSKYQESLTICRRQTEELRTPESQRNLVISLHRVADIEVARGDLDAALAKYQESLTICRRLMEELRTPESQRGVSISLGRVADIEVARGDLDAALAKYQESLTICRRLVDDLGTPQSQQDVGISLHCVAHIEKTRGDLDAALAKYQESLAIRRRLVEELRTPESQQDVGISLQCVADIEAARGDLDAALAKYRESLTIFRRLAEELRTPESQHDVGISLHYVADIEAARGDLDLALAKYRESLTIARRLAEELRTPDSQRDVSVSLNRVADIEKARGDIDAALAKYRESLTIARRLAEELRTPESRRDVSVSLNRVADIEKASGDIDAALRKYQESLTIRRQLVEELRTPGSQRDVSVSLDRVAAIEAARGNLDAALAMYQERLTICRRLTEELRTPESQRDVGISLSRMAMIKAALGDLDAALAMCHESLEISRFLEEKLDTPEIKQEVSVGLATLTWIEQKRGSLGK